MSGYSSSLSSILSVTTNRVFDENIGLSRPGAELMVFALYSCIITFILLSVFAIGAISFSDTLLDWIDRHWEEIR